MILFQRHYLTTQLNHMNHNSCLTAVPPQAYNLVPEPYNSLLLEPKHFEDLYRNCIDSNTTVFDMEQFQSKCAAFLSKTQSAAAPSPSKHKHSSGSAHRNIYTGTSYWTVISRSKAPLRNPFSPPKPYTCESKH